MTFQRELLDHHRCWAYPEISLNMLETMKIALFSDLHLEFPDARHFVPETSDADIVVLAGDIAVGTEGIQWAARTFTQPVVYVAGNHEFYEKGHLERLPATLKEAARATPNVRYLESESTVIDGVRFIGATLWTDFCLFGDDARSAAMYMARECMNDYRQIRMSRPGAPDNWKPTKLRPEAVSARHSRSRRYLESALQEPFDGPTVVVTHHAPSRRSVPEQFSGDLLSSCYASDLEAMMNAEWAPQAWLHGHMHHSLDYRVGATRVRTNPRGYPEPDGTGENPDFVTGVCLEIERSMRAARPTPA
jgi:Icc-related predicted phosphoesterase